MQTIWGIDLGGTKIEGVVLGSPSPEAVIARRRIDTEAHLGYPHIVGQIKKLVTMQTPNLGKRMTSSQIVTQKLLSLVLVADWILLIV